MTGPIFDWWVIPHIAFFIVLGSTVEAIWRLTKDRWWVHLIYGLGVGYGWEVLEHFLQRAYPDLWSNHIEHWANAWIVDPVTDLLGLAIGVAIARWSWKRKSKSAPFSQSR